MKLARSLVTVSLIFSTALLSFIALPITAHGQDAAKIALQRGYRTGYSDGYMAGYRDIIDNVDKSYTRHSDYGKADRAYNKDYGTIEDYKDGYQQGFESGYDTGFEKRSFDAQIPANIGRRGMAKTNTPPPPPAKEAVKEPITETQSAATTPIASTPIVETPIATTASDASEPQPEPQRSTIQKVAYVTSDDPVIIIPRDTEIILELDEEIDTERNREGDKFTARIVSPVEIAGARIEGHIDKVTKPGRIKRRSEMLLSFDRLVINERRWTNFDALVTEVLPVKGDNVKNVDDEGTAIGKSSLKGDLTKVGVATGAGAGIGLIGGPVGMAVGAGVGAAFGVGAVVIERGKHIRLSQAQQLRIKTSYETQIR